jgi:hypothetical protein
MATLYEEAQGVIDSLGAAIEGGEGYDAWEKNVADAQASFEAKLDKVQMARLSLLAEVSAMEAEVEKFKARIAATNKSVKWLNGYMMSAMQKTKTDKTSLLHGNITVCKGKKSDKYDVDTLPKKLVKEEVVRTPDKEAIAAWEKEKGKLVKGHLVVEGDPYLMFSGPRVGKEE